MNGLEKEMNCSLKVVKYLLSMFVAWHGVAHQAERRSRGWFLPVLTV